MGRKPLIWLSLALLFICVPVIARQYQSSQPGLDQQNPNLPQNQGKDVNQSQSSTTVSKSVNSSGPYAIGYEEGYKSGFDHGKSDFTSGAKYDHDDYRDYKHPGSTAWNSSMGSKSKFRKNYRRGFRIGYEDGYSGKPSQFAVAPAPLPVPQAQAPVQPETSLSTESSENETTKQESGTIDQNPPVSSQSQSSTIEQNPPSSTPSSTVETPANQNMSTNTEESRHLPKTASPLPLIGLIGILAIPLAFALRLLGNRMA